MLDILLPYLPGQPKQACDNFFAGTLPSPPCTAVHAGNWAPTDAEEQACLAEHPGWSPYSDLMVEPDSVALGKHIEDSIAIAAAFTGRYPDTIAHWYLTYEAYLGQLMASNRFDKYGYYLHGGPPAQQDEDRDAARQRDAGYQAAVRAGYLRHQRTLISGLMAIRDRAVLWSPALEQNLGQLELDGNLIGLEANLVDHFTRLREATGLRSLWLHPQDMLSRTCVGEYPWSQDTSTTTAWYHELRKLNVPGDDGQPLFAGLEINAEMFAYNCPAENTQEKVLQRLRDYDDASVPLGTSFDINHWYAQIHAGRQPHQLAENHRQLMQRLNSEQRGSIRRLLYQPGSAPAPSRLTIPRT